MFEGTLLLAACLAQASPTPKPAADTRLFEMRTYYAMPGKLDALNARFRNHTVKLFAKHGMTNIGYWVPVDNTDNKLVYLLAFPSREARDKAFAEFGADPEWQTAAKESEKDGKLVDHIESLFLSPADYVPATRPSKAAKPRLFELRVYTAAEGRLDALQARFKEHTLALFRKHRMGLFGFWMPAEGAQGAGSTLVYILAHKDQAAADKAWKAFREDPAWVKAKAASEANGALTAAPPKSTYLEPTDYSPTR